MNGTAHENLTISRLQKSLMPYKPGEAYRALEDYDLLFSLSEVLDFMMLWQQGHSLEDIWKYLKKYNKERTYNEISLLLFDLHVNGKIEQRDHGIQKAEWSDEED
jgi:hypothetical protein